MALTSIGQQKTPGRPVEITFAAETGLPSDNQEVLLIGHADASIPASGLYVVKTISNSGDLTAASGEVAEKFGDGSELAKMVLAAIRANTGASTMPQLKAIALDDTDTDFGAADAALTAAAKVKAEYVVSCYDLTDSALRGKLKDTALLMSGAQRVHNNQFGTIGVAANMSVTDPDNLPAADSQFIAGMWMKDTSSNAYSVGEVAAACAAKMAGNVSPFNPLDDVSIIGIPAPALDADWITVGAALESEVCLAKGVTPLRVKANGEVAFVRTVTSRISPDGTGTPIVGAYYDVQDFNVLYFFRKTIYTRFSQPDFKQRKLNNETAREAKAEVVRLMRAFEDQGMFQAVEQHAKLVLVERNVSDRHRLDIKIPVNVVPGLHVVASNIVAGTLYDVITV